MSRDILILAAGILLGICAAFTLFVDASTPVEHHVTVDPGPLAMEDWSLFYSIAPLWTYRGDPFLGTSTDPVERPMSMLDRLDEDLSFRAG